MKIQNCLLSLPLLLLSFTLTDAGQRIAGIGLAKDDHVYVWFADGKVTSGTSQDFERYSHAYPYSLPPGKSPADIVAVSVSGSNTHVFAWYRDGSFSSGTAEDLGRYTPPLPYILPPRKTVGDIVGIGIAGSNNRVYTWYRDGTVSSGTPHDLAKYVSPHPYYLPHGKTTADILEIDVAKSDDRVYTWYRDGTASSGLTNNLGSHSPSFGYVPSQVLYRWWGPALPGYKPHDAILPGGKQAAREPAEDDDDGPPEGGPQPAPASDPPHDGSPALSPNWSAPRFTPDTGSPKDPMLAVGDQYIIASDAGTFSFYDKQGNPLPEKNGVPTTVYTGDFFKGFLTKTNDDGSPNETNINLYLDFPKPCDSPDYPQTTSGQRFCVSEFYDTRVIFDPASKRFFVMAQARHILWKGNNYGGCVYYEVPLSSVPDTSVCKKIDDNKTKCTLAPDKYCDLTRRYVAFAVSRTEDPRDGFHQYMITESNLRDWPWMAVNGDAFIVAHKDEFGNALPSQPVITVFSVAAVKSGEQHPPYFRYYGKDVDGHLYVLPPVHYKNAGGLTFLLGGREDKHVDIYAFPPPADPWKAPALLKTSVLLGGKASVFNSVYRAGKLYLVTNRAVEEAGGVKRYSVRLTRIPVAQTPAGLTASTRASEGFLERVFGRNAPGDLPSSRVSYEVPSLAVNGGGDMLFAYRRYPFSPKNSPYTEARYTVWYANEPMQRGSRQLQSGAAAISPDPQLDYTTAVVDPSDDKTFWMALAFADSGGYRTVIGKVTP